MKWPAAFAFIVLFLLVGAFYLWVEHPAPAKIKPAIQPASQAAKDFAPKPQQTLQEDAEETFSPNLLNLLPEDRLTLVQIQNLESKKTLKLVFENGHWQIKFPVRDEADSARVEELLHGLLSAQKLRQLKPEKDWEEYGLARPRKKIGLETAKKPERRYLYLGNVSPVGNVLFARWEDEKNYFLLPVSFQAFFEESVYAFREKRLFLRSGETPRKLSLHTPTGDYEIENQGNRWVWIDPEAMRWAPCPAGDAEALLEKLRGLFIKDFLDSTSGDETGLDGTGIRIRVDLDEAEAEVLDVGKEAGVRDAFYARRSAEDGTLLVARDKLNAFFDLFRSLAAQKLTQP